VIPARYARLFAAAVMGAASISAANARDGFTTDGKQHHDGKHHHDGTYAVYITTNRGDCDKHYHWMILVSGGRVSSAGHTPMNASGHINPRGNVHLTFKRFHHAATATGRLTTEAGSGTWHSPTMECAGSWHARRRSDRTCGAAV
jgi:hypothetical protein